jgi:uncharacterized protein DUF4126
VDLFLAISQGAGLALATGVRPFLPPLVVGVLARADAGVNFSGSDFSFLESVPFLAAMVALTAIGLAAERSSRGRALVVSFAVVAAVLGALEFAGSLSGEGYAGGPGLPAGAALALVGFAAAAVFLGRARARLAARADDESTSFLTTLADGATALAAVLAVLVPPLSYALLAFCLWILAMQRRRAGRKYEGLRVLR